MGNTKSSVSDQGDSGWLAGLNLSKLSAGLNDFDPGVSKEVSQTTVHAITDSLE